MRWLTITAFLFALLTPLAAQDGTLTLTAAFEPATAKPGDKVVLVLSCDVTEGWHAYGTLEKTNTPVSLAPENVNAGALTLDGAAEIPPGMRKMLGNLPTFPLPNQFKVKQPMTVPAGTAEGEITVTGELDYGICNDTGCLPPEKAPFTAKLFIGDKPVVAATSDTSAVPTTTKPGLQLAPDDKVTIAAKFDPATARAGEVTTLVLTVTVHDPAWHAYGSLETEQTPVGLPTDNVDAGVLERVGEADVPPGTATEKANKTTYPLPPVFEVKQLFRVPAGTKPGVVDVSGALVYQICDARVCEPTSQLDFEVKLTVEAGDARADRLGPAKTEPPKKDPPKPANGSGETPTNAIPTENPYMNWWVLILACIGGGLFALAMPCTYPMIPITFSFFTKQAEKRGGNVLSLAITYGLGIIVMFVLVGVLLSTVILDIANHWATNSVIGIVFLLFSFSLFGWITLEPPQFLQSLAGKASSKGGYAGVFFMGAALVITSFTCTAPIVGTILPQIVELGYTRVSVGMAVFGLTMALPFVVLSLMPSKVRALPRSGDWMETLKVSLGFVELAATLKFVSMVDIALDWNALPRELFLLLIVAIFVLWAMYLFGILRKAGTVNEGVGAGRMATGMAVVLVATYFLFGAMGYKLDYYMTAFAPPYSAPLSATRADASGATNDGKPKQSAYHTIVKDDGDRALELAKAEDKLLLYNFTGFN